MEPEEYARMARFETTYWWYRAQRDVVLDCMERLPRNGDGPILDAGCGTGLLQKCVANRLQARVIGVDASAIAGERWRRNGLSRACLGSVNRLPFSDNSFDIVYSVDVICCREVDPTSACAEFARVLRPGGHLVLVVPAYQWLLSAHDQAVHCVQRFDRRMVASLLRAAELTIARRTNLFCAFFPVIAAARLMRRGAHARSDRPLHSDLRPIPGALNRMLYGIAQIERRMVRRMSLPFGTTLLTVARKAV